MNCAAARLLRGAAASLLLALAAPAAGAAETIPVPRLSGRVVDLTGTLAVPEREAIAATLEAFEKRKGSQVAVLLVPSLGQETIEEFATRVTDEWKLGRAGVDDGVLFVIAMQERRMRIQTGRGVQGTLTDALAKRIVADFVTPKFRAGDFAGGISDAVGAIVRAIDGEALPPPAAKRTRPAAEGTEASLEDFFWMAFVGVPLAGMFLRPLVGRLLGAGLTSGLTGLAAWLLFGSLLVGAIAALVAFVIVVFMGAPGLGARRGGWSTGGWGGGGGGGFGGGGFSGGGGGFDGGGASGSW